MQDVELAQRLIDTFQALLPEFVWEFSQTLQRPRAGAPSATSCSLRVSVVNQYIRLRVF